MTRRRHALSLIATLLSPVLAASVGGTLGGRIIDWPAGGAAEMWLGNPDQPVLAKGTIDANGVFRLTLPASLPADTLLVPVTAVFSDHSPYGEACRGTGESAPDTAQHEWYALTAVRDGEPLGDLKLESTSRYFPVAGDTEAKLLYFSAATTFNGTISCPAQVERVSGRYAMGWNLAVRHITALSPSGTLTSTLTNAAVPSSLAWRLYEELGGIGIEMRAGTTGGVEIVTVRPQGPAAKAGVQVGDMFIAVDGQDVTALPFAQVPRLVQGQAGSQVTLNLERAGHTEVMTLTRTLIRLP